MIWIVQILLAIAMVLMIGSMFMLHSAGCSMHAYAVERLWRDDPSSRQEWVWSHAYCKVVAIPFDVMMGD